MRALHLLVVLSLWVHVFVKACLPPQTPIFLADNSILPIADIRVGAAVWGFDHEKIESISNNIPVQQHVVQTFSRTVAQLVQLTLEDSLALNGTKDEVSTALLSITLDHAVYEEEKEWILASELEQGDNLISSLGRLIRVVEVQNVSYDAMVFNIEVLNFHSYYASDLQVLVHNPPKGPATKKPAPKKANDKTKDGKQLYIQKHEFTKQKKDKVGRVTEEEAESTTTSKKGKAKRGEAVGTSSGQKRAKGGMDEGHMEIPGQDGAKAGNVDKKLKSRVNEGDQNPQINRNQGADDKWTMEENFEHDTAATVPNEKLTRKTKRKYPQNSDPDAAPIEITKESHYKKQKKEDAKLVIENPSATKKNQNLEKVGKFVKKGQNFEKFRKAKFPKATGKM